MLSGPKWWTNDLQIRTGTSKAGMANMIGIINLFKTAPWDHWHVETAWVYMNFKSSGIEENKVETRSIAVGLQPMDVHVSVNLNKH